MEHPPTTVHEANSRPNKRRKRSTLRQKYTHALDDIWEWSPSKCCNRLCHIQLGVERCRYLRKEFLESSTVQRKEKLLRFRVGLNEEGDQAARLEIDRVTVCTAFWKNVLNVSNTLRSAVLGRPSATATYLPGRIRGGQTSESKESGIIAFLRKLVDDIGDSMPHKAERHLPHKSKVLVLLQYCETEILHGREPATSSHFYATWKKLAPEIKCVRSHNFETCETWITFKDNQLLMANGKLTGKTRAAVLASFNRHLVSVKQERAEYKRIREMAADRPGEILSVIIDGTDQAKFGLPRFTGKSKCERGHALKQKVTGVLMHGGLGRADLFCIFTARENIPGGSNQTIDVFCRAFFTLIKRRALEDSFRTFPTELYLQLDNTVKDNKNRFVFSFCEYLVHLGIFKRVTVNFLPVGHTHEDIDRKFSRISVKLAQLNTVTVSELHSALRTSEKTAVHPVLTRVLSHMNFSGCLVEQKCAVTSGQGISLYRKFVFQRKTSVSSRFGEVYKVTCKAGFTMTTPEQDLVLLEQPEGNIGCFLTKVPDTKKIPPTKFKKISISDADEFRSRIRSTESRIRSQEKCQSLLKEADMMEHIGEGRAEWDFQQLLSMQGRADTAEECDSESDAELVDAYSYEKGDMVTIRSSTGSRSVTPFWLASIVDVKVSQRSSKTLVVQWYMLKSRTTRLRSGENVCFEGQYEPCNPKQESSYDEIPCESVYCCFEALISTGSLLLRAQQHTRQAIIDSEEGVSIPLATISGNVPSNEYENERNESILHTLGARAPSLGYIVTVSCPDEESVPFWVGKVLSFYSRNVLKFRVEWYKARESVDSAKRYHEHTFIVDRESPRTTVSIESVLATFKSLTRRGQIPKKALKEILKL